MRYRFPINTQFILHLVLDRSFFLELIVYWMNVCFMYLLSYYPILLLMYLRRHQTGMMEKIDLITIEFSILYMFVNIGNEITFVGVGSSKLNK